MSQIFVAFAIAEFDERITLFLLLKAYGALRSGLGCLFAYIYNLGLGKTSVCLVQVCCH